MSQPSPLKPALQSLRDRPDELIEIILRQAGVIEQMRQELAALKKQIDDLNDRNDGLSAKVARLQTAAARQAAPLRIRDKLHVTDPKKPGRKKGHPGSYRTVPDHVDERISVPLAACPECGQVVGKCREVVQYLEELPVVRPKVIQLVTHEAACPHCRKTVRSTHPLQMSLAEGAAGVQLGPLALGLAAELNKKHGLTVRKTCAVLKQVFNLSLRPGGLTQALARLAGKLEPAYEKLMARLRDGPYLHSDETSWWVGGPGYWLWVFADKTTTVYRVAKGRGRSILSGVIGDQFSGVLVSDCLATYDDVNALQQKCYSHPLKAIGQGLEAGPSGPGSKRCAGCSRRPWRSSANPAGNPSHNGASWNAKPINSCRGHAQPTPRKKCAAASKNSATICSPSWITRRSMPPITWRNASCGQPSLPAKYPAATKPPKELTPGKSSPAWPPPAPRKANPSPTSSANQPR